jgi:hypothetical protein
MPMKKLLVFAVTLTLGATVLIAQTNARARTFTGAIMDSQCAAQGNHDAGYKVTGTNTAKDCTLAWVKSGAQFVLYNSGRKLTYKLDDQEKPRDFAGDNVKVIGTYDSSMKTIHVEKIEAAK